MCSLELLRRIVCVQSAMIWQSPPVELDSKGRRPCPPVFHCCRFQEFGVAHAPDRGTGYRTAQRALNR